MTLAQLLEDPTLRVLVGEFVSELPDRISQLREAAQADDHTKAQHLSHQLKGAGGSYGFENISHAAAKIEKICLKEATQEELIHSVEQLAKEIEVARLSWEAS